MRASYNSAILTRTSARKFITISLDLLTILIIGIIFISAPQYSTLLIHVGFGLGKSTLVLYHIMLSTKQNGDIHVCTYFRYILGLGNALERRCC